MRQHPGSSSPKPWWQAPRPSYNGFDWETRYATNRPQRIAIKSGIIQQPTVCSITGFSRPEDLQGAGYIFPPLENYSKPLDFYPGCKSAHAALHARFRDPARWFRLVSRHYVHGAWWTFLSMLEADMLPPFAEVYPEGLPAPGELWERRATELEISPALFAPNSTHRGNPFRVSGAEFPPAS